MKKEKHPVYWAVMAAFILLLAIGVTLFVCAVAVGKGRIILPFGRSV